MNHAEIESWDQDLETQSKTAAEPGGFGLFAANQTARYVTAGVLALLAVLSFFALAGHFSSAETYAGTLESLDAKKTTVMELIGGSTAASGAITLLPGDAGTPIAEKLVDLSSDFLVVLTAIYLEKYLLTTLGFAAFKILIPAGCVLAAAVVLMPGNWRMRRTLQQLAWKLVVFGFAIFLAVPGSVFVSNMIEATYQDSIDETLATAQQTADAIQESTGATSGESDGSADANAAESDSQGATGILGAIQSIPETITSLPETVQNIPGNVTQLTADAQTTLNNFIEALAMMIVTSCVIPILVLLFFLWLAKLILGVDVEIPAGMLKSRTFRRL